MISRKRNLQSYFWNFQEYFFKSQESLATVIDNEEEEDEDEHEKSEDEIKSQDSLPDHSPKTGQKASEKAEKGEETQKDNSAIATTSEDDENMKTASLKTTNVWVKKKLSFKKQR